MADTWREKNTIILCIIICTTLIICGVLFWPTLYRYDKTNFGNKRSGQYFIRVNRLTGYAETLHGSGWEPMRGEEKAIAMPQDERDKVKINGYFHNIENNDGYKGDIYNGTSWTINKLRLSIGAKDKDGKIQWQKTYEASVYIAPFSTGSFSIKLTDSHYFVPNAKAKGEGWTLSDTPPEALSSEVKIEEIFGYKGGGR